MSLVSDTHGQNYKRIINLSLLYPEVKPQETALIILGDAGFNFYLNKTDKNNKRNTNNLGYTIYCVRGNHEERPENLGMKIIYDPEVKGKVYVEKDYPLIKYFIDGNEYLINGLKTLVIGGAYSVDKYYRIEGAKPGHWTGWFPEEQLTKEEMKNIGDKTKNKKYHMILSHTCPYSWRPTDLFLSGLDQSIVDSTMEIWMDNLKNNFSYDIWLFGHFHDDRLVRPGAEMFFENIENLNNIISRWNSNSSFISDKIKDPKYYWD